MQKRAVLFTVLAVSTAQALTLQGAVSSGARSLPGTARLGAWSLGPAGAAGSELASAPISSGRFALDWPEGAPPSRAQFPLRPETIIWPGVVGDVKMSTAVQSSAVGLFVYNDANQNGKRDDNEALMDAFADVQRQPLVLVWLSSAVTVSAGHGFSAELSSGWNAFLVDLGRNSSISRYGGQPLNLRVQP